MSASWITLQAVAIYSYQEVIYQRALDIEFAQQGLTASREHEMDIYYYSSLGFAVIPHQIWRHDLCSKSCRQPAVQLRSIPVGLLAKQSRYKPENRNHREWVAPIRFD